MSGSLCKLPVPKQHIYDANKFLYDLEPFKSLFNNDPELSNVVMKAVFYWFDSLSPYFNMSDKLKKQKIEKSLKIDFDDVYKKNKEVFDEYREIHDSLPDVQVLTTYKNYLVVRKTAIESMANELTEESIELKDRSTTMLNLDKSLNNTGDLITAYHEMRNKLSEAKQEIYGEGKSTLYSEGKIQVNKKERKINPEEIERRMSNQLLG